MAKKYNYKREQDLENIDELLAEAKKGIKDKKRTWEDVPKSLKKRIKNGFPALTGLALAAFVFHATMRSTRSLKKSVCFALGALGVWFLGLFFGNKRNSKMSELEIAKLNEIIKTQSEIIEAQDAAIEESEKRENKLLKIIKHQKTEHDCGPHNEYLDKINGSLEEVSSKIRTDLALDGITV